MIQAAKQLIFDLGYRSALEREDFLISPANEDAVKWIDMWPEWPAPTLIIHGPAASGKTHLAAVWAKKTQAVKISSEELILKEANTLAKLGENLVIDHIDPWIGDKPTETTLFHLYNIMKEEQRTLLLTMRMCPAQADFTIPDLASRLRAAPLASIHPPDDNLLAAILVKLFADRQIQVSAEALNYILPRMERSFSAARDIVDVADKMALSEKRPVSIPLLRQILLQSSELTY